MEYELVHWGVKGMRWGVRRYQNKDGSLTPAGKKRYDKEMDKLKAEEKKLKAEEKIQSNRKKTQAKLDKLETKKAEIQARKKALKDGSYDGEEKPVETPEAKKARLLKSTDAKDLYDNRGLFTTAELNERINRIDTEARLGNIAKSTTQSGMDYVNSKMKTTADTVNNATNMFKKVDEAYSAVSNSAIGKTIAKKLGIEPPKQEFDLNKFWANRNKMSAKEIQEVSQRLANEKRIEDEIKRRKKVTEESSNNAKDQTKEKTKSKKVDYKPVMEAYSEEINRNRNVDYKPIVDAYLDELKKNKQN